MARADEPIRQLAVSLDENPEGPIRLVFTGQYNAGKSTLIRALTGRTDIVIDSDVATAEVTEYPWGDVLLVDTPGVQAGVQQHDVKAEEALRDSDLVVFVVSVDLLDDAAVRHLDHVASALGKRRNMVAAVNKAGSLEADPEIRIEAIREALGPGVDVPVVLTDALDHLDAEEEGDEEVRVGLLDSGNIQGLVSALNSLVTRAGQESRLRRPFEKIVAVCAEAVELLTDDPREQAARKVLNRQRRLVTSSRRRLEHVFDSRLAEYRRAMLTLAESVADKTEAAEDLPDDARTLEVERIDAAFRKGAAHQTDLLLDILRRDVEREASLASEELRELAGSPQLAVLVSEGVADGTQSGIPAGARGVKKVSQQPPDIAATMRAIGQGAGRFASRWGGGAGLRSYSGTAGHKTVYSVGKAIGMDFKPWQAVRYARSIGAAARVVNKAMPFVAIGMDTFLAIKADRAEARFAQEQQARRRAILDQVKVAANEVETEVRTRLDLAMADFYGPVLRQVEDQQAELDQADASREGMRGELARSMQECADELRVLDVIDADAEVQEFVEAATRPNSLHEPKS